MSKHVAIHSFCYHYVGLIMRVVNLLCYHFFCFGHSGVQPETDPLGYNLRQIPIGYNLRQIPGVQPETDPRYGAIHCPDCRNVNITGLFYTSFHHMNSSKSMALH